MNLDWPVRETWRASFILCLWATTAWGDGPALVAEARSQDPARLASWCATLERAAAPSERAAAAFAIGQLGTAWVPPPEAARTQAESALLAALAKRQDASVRDRVLEALGKVGRGSSLPSLRAALDGPQRARAALALAALAKNHALTDREARARLERQLADADRDARYGAALALQRYHDPASRPALRRCLGDGAVHVRATCAKALADAGSDDDAAALAPLLDDGDVRVAAEAARSLVKLAMKCGDAACASRERLRASKLPWRAAVVQAVTFEHWRGPAAAELLQLAAARAHADETVDGKTRVVLGCKLAMAHDRALGRLQLLPSCGAVDERQRGVWMAQALADGGGAELATLAQSRFPAVREAAAEGADAATTLRLLADADAPVVAAAAERAAALKLVDAGPLLSRALERLRGPLAVEAQQALLATAAALRLTAMAPAARRLLDVEPYALRQAAAQALTTLEGQPVAARPPTPSPEPTPRLPPTTVRLRTTRGLIRARLWVDDAPRTAANLVTLARRHFFDGLTFHRVVPDFVSQGGDPRGDGSGGPGYMIPCEIGMRRYQEGVLGMALSGRDTGGSQFFFTHSPQPHLDGRYTAFGEVIAGLDVVAQLVEGDLILELTIE